VSHAQEADHHADQLKPVRHLQRQK
jgi:hypothetical protein